MPELPEVQTTVKGINSRAKNLTITDVWSDYASPAYVHKEEIKNRTYFKKVFKPAVVGARIKGSERRGKNILIHLSNSYTILIHMKMTGHILYGTYEKGHKKDSKERWHATTKGALQDPFNRFIHLVFVFSNGKHLVLSDMRKFAKVTLIDSEKINRSPHLSHIGPEPLSKEFTIQTLREALHKKPRGFLKQVLMDQTVIAGIGNIYSDEILWATNLHPKKKVGSLSSKEISALFKNIQLILRKGIDFKGDSMSDYRTIDGTPGMFQHEHRAYRKTNKPCTKRGCDGVIKRILVGGRSAHFCNVHQKR